MRLYHLASLIRFIANLPAKANTNSNDEDGTAVDLVAEGQFHSGLAVCQVGAPTGSPASFSVAFTLEESDDNIAWSTAKNSDGENAIVTLTAEGIGKIDFFPNQLKQYVRLNRTVATTGGSTPTVPTAGTLLLGAGRAIPVS